MKILLVAATSFEVHQFVDNLEKIDGDDSFVSSYKWHDLDIDLLITGIGMVFTTYNLTRVLKEDKYDLVINAGIAGTFNDELSIGTVVNVKSEQFSDLGIEEPGTFKTLFEVGFLEKDQFPFKDGKLLNPYNNGELNLPSVNGISGNMSHGCPNTISNIVKEFSPDIESMEGGAVFYVCLLENITFLEIRAISNIVESRDTTKWDIPTALENLTDELFKILRTFATIGQLT